MSVLPQSESWHYNGAEGWLMLGNAKEAESEWNLIDPQYHGLPQVLALKWRIHALAGDWIRAAETAVKQCEADPQDPGGYIHHAYSERRKPDGSLQKAWDILQAARVRFPMESIVPYNLACYAAQMGRLDEAWTLLQEAGRLAGNAPVKAMALHDEDLVALRPKIEAML
jgi:hypothetical protein